MSSATISVGDTCWDFSESSCVNPNLLFVSSLTTNPTQSIAMFIARIVFFRLEESAKFLANAGDHAGALVALQRISKINGDSESEWSLEDVIDRLPTKELEGEGISGKYDAMGESEESYEERSNASPVAEEPPIGPLYQYGVSSSNLSVEERKRGEKLVMGSSWVGQIPMKLWDSMGDFPERIDRLFEPEWALTTKLVWVIWFAASAGYTVSLSLLPPWRAVLLCCVLEEE